MFKNIYFFNKNKLKIYYNVLEELKYIIIFGEFSNNENFKNNKKYKLINRNKLRFIKNENSNSNKLKKTLIGIDTPIFTAKNLGILSNQINNNKLIIKTIKTIKNEKSCKDASCMQFYNTNELIYNKINIDRIKELLTYIEIPESLNKISKKNNKDKSLKIIIQLFNDAHYLQMSSLMELIIKRLIDLKIYTTYFD